jgi:hypothetical protein
MKMRCRSYHTENTVRDHYKDQSVNAVGLQGTVPVCIENNANHNTQYGENSVFLDDAAGKKKTVITGF